MRFIGNALRLGLLQLLAARFDLRVEEAQRLAGFLAVAGNIVVLGNVDQLLNDIARQLAAWLLHGDGEEIILLGLYLDIGAQPFDLACQFCWSVAMVAPRSVPRTTFARLPDEVSVWPSS